MEIIKGAGLVLRPTTVDCQYWYDFDTASFFSLLGPNLPRPISAHSMVEYDDSLLLIGGSDHDSGEILTSILSLTCEDRICFWTELNQTLSLERYAMVAAIIPDSMTNC